MSHPAIQHAYNDRIWRWPKSLPRALQQGLVWFALAVVGAALVFRLWLHRRTKAALAADSNGRRRAACYDRRKLLQRRDMPERIDN